MSQNLFLHLTTKRDWEKALLVGRYEVSTNGKTLAEVGFIHGSFADQLQEVVGFVFAGSTEDLVVLHLDTEKLEVNGIPVRVEMASNGQKYPHVYGAIPCALIDKVVSAYMNTEGRLTLET